MKASTNEAVAWFWGGMTEYGLLIKIAIAKTLSNGVGHRTGRHMLTRLRQAAGLSVISLLSLGLTGCISAPVSSTKASKAHINEKTKFSAADFGVDASPRVTTEKRPKKGGGRSFVGKPYRVRGKWYTPKEQPGYDRAGLASWYGPNFHGRLTANGEIYDQYHLSAAHPTFPLPSYARVTNKKNGNSVIVRVNDRGPFAHGRIIDLSNKAAQLLNMKNEGVAAVRVQYVGRAPVEGDDTKYLVASYRPGGSGQPAGGVIATGVLLAVNSAASVLPDLSLPGTGLTPPESIGANGATGSVQSAASAAAIPLDFKLPAIGPVVPVRPSLTTPLALNSRTLGGKGGQQFSRSAYWGRGEGHGRSRERFETLLKEHRDKS